jgi:transcriptional regulator with XRE-family HTH domain
MPLRKQESLNGEELRRLRNLKGMKQATVANALGISHQAYSKIERCKKVGTKKVTEVLAALNCTIDDLEKMKSYPPSINRWLTKQIPLLLN